MRCSAKALFFMTMALLTAPAAGLAQTDAKKADTPVDRGKAVFIDRERGHCLLCHQVSQIKESFQGNIGPDLSNIGARLGPDELYKRIADPTEQNPNTVMPAYFRTHGLVQVAQAYQDRPVLNASEMHDLVAFLLTLQGSDRQK